MYNDYMSDEETKEMFEERIEKLEGIKKIKDFKKLKEEVSKYEYEYSDGLIEENDTYEMIIEIINEEIDKLQEICVELDNF